MLIVAKMSLIVGLVLFVLLCVDVHSIVAVEQTTAYDVRELFRCPPPSIVNELDGVDVRCTDDSITHM